MKGYERPYIPEDLRLDNLAELSCVDYVALSEDEWAGTGPGSASDLTSMSKGGVRIQERPSFRQ